MCRGIQGTAPLDVHGPEGSKTSKPGTSGFEGMHLQDSRSPQADGKDIFATGGCIIYVVQDVACGCQVQDVGLEDPELAGSF